MILNNRPKVDLGKMPNLNLNFALIVLIQMCVALQYDVGIKV